MVGISVQTVSNSQFPLISEGSGFLLRRNLIVLMLALTILPLTVMAVLNFLQYRRAITREVEQPVRVLANKSRHSF